MRVIGLGHGLFAAGLLGIGVLGFIYRDFAMVWQPVPQWVPWREALAFASAAVLVACAVGILLSGSAALSSRVLIVYLLLWLLLLRVPAVVERPFVEASWLGCGETAVMVAGGWVLLALLGGIGKSATLGFVSGESGVRLARILFGLALPAVGLSHIVYVADTANLVPEWLPYRTGWAYLTGAGHIAAGIGVLFAIYPRLAAKMEALMMAVFTLLIWLPAALTARTDRLQWTALAISWTLAAGAWVVADSYCGTRWLAIGWARLGSAERIASGKISP